MNTDKCVLKMLLLAVMWQPLSLLYADACSQYYAQRNAWFGDLHVHTALSMDASMQGARVQPLDAYRFARGEALGLPPYAPDGTSQRIRQLARPLDFAAVTDHAELLGELQICENEDLDGYRSPYCLGLRASPRWFGLLFSHTAARASRLGVCGEGGERCLEASLVPWYRIRAAAELAYDRSRECQFTTFVGYEWTGAGFPERGRVSNLHRNVIFRSADVPDLPVSFVEAHTPDKLYSLLDAQCRFATVESGADESLASACDAIVIPHNSNLSLGQMFAEDPLWLGVDAEAALERRRHYERLLEIIQHKGASECFYAEGDVLASDELCAFEQLPWDSFSGNLFPQLARPMNPGSGFAREGLKRGIQWQAQRGVNPFQLGFVGGSDSHMGLAGAVEEDAFAGHGGAGNAARNYRSRELPDQVEFNPGGLTVLYAEQNSRDSLFQALQRRESYATSGPRLKVRFFGGERLPEDYCERADALQVAYQTAVPMGGELRDLAVSPHFVVAAQMDPGTEASPGRNLQRIQIIKAWVDSEGEAQERVYDVAGDASPAASADDCGHGRGGYRSLCRVWQDPEFDAAAAAFYYARVLEQPRCRWQAAYCEREAVDCSSGGMQSKLQQSCCNGAPRHIQERAWTSPIWYEPPITGRPAVDN